MTLHEMSNRIVRAMGIAEAICCLLPAVIGVLMMVVLTRYSGLNVFTVSIDAILVLMILGSITNACETYAKLPPGPAPEDRRRFLGNDNLATRTPQNRDDRNAYVQRHRR